MTKAGAATLRPFCYTDGLPISSVMPWHPCRFTSARARAYGVEFPEICMVGKVTEWMA